MDIQIGENYKDKLLIGGGVFIIALNIFGLRYPYSVGLFLPCTLILGILYLSFRRKIVFTKAIIPFLILVLTYVLPFLIWRESFRGVLARDLSNILSLCLFGYILMAIIRTKDELDAFYTWTGVGIIVLTSITSLIGFLKFYFLWKNHFLPAFDFPPDEYPWGTSLVTDYNYYALGGLAGLVSSVFIYRKFSSSTWRVLLVVAGVLNTYSIVFSGSRRGLMLLVIILTIVLVYVTVRFLKKSLSLLTQLLAGLSLTFILLTSITYFHYAFEVTAERKKELAIGLKCDSIEMPRAFARLTFRYATILKPKITQAEVYYYFLPSRLWNTEKPLKDLYQKRSEKWIYALQVFRKYPVINKITGGGFSYIHLFGQRFVKTPQAEDYPHNYGLSSLLYSGLIGLSFMLILMALVTWLYFKYLKLYPLFAVFFVLTQLFAVTSGNSIFSEKFTAILLVFPFIFQSIRAPNSWFK